MERETMRSFCAAKASRIRSPVGDIGERIVAQGIDLAYRAQWCLDLVRRPDILSSDHFIITGQDLYSNTLFDSALMAGPALSLGGSRNAI